MAKKLTKKQRGFVNDYVETGNATFAAKENYNITTEGSARAVGSENLTKPNIQAELHRLGFDENNAKRVVAEILNDETNDPHVRLKASDQIFKVRGTYAAEKTQSLNLNIDTKYVVENSELEKLDKEYEEKVKELYSRGKHD
jgi:hypothetical protein